MTRAHELTAKFALSGMFQAPLVTSLDCYRHGISLNTAIREGNLTPVWSYNLYALTNRAKNNSLAMLYEYAKHPSRKFELQSQLFKREYSRGFSSTNLTNYPALAWETLEIHTDVVNGRGADPVSPAFEKNNLSQAALSLSRE